MRKHDDVMDDLTAKASKFLITLLNLLIKRLILDLQLLVVDQMETFSQLLLLLENLLLVLETVSQGDVL